jgi:hypothetical protein
MGRIDTNECWLVGLRIGDWKPEVVEGIEGDSLSSCQIKEKTKTRMLESVSCCI